MNSEEEGQKDQQEQQMPSKPEEKACESFQTISFTKRSQRRAVDDQEWQSRDYEKPGDESSTRPRKG
jgi:hypothetical protein